MIKEVAKAEDIEPPGFFSMPEDLYFNGPGLSQSRLKTILKTPAGFKVANKIEPTEAMRLGSVVHQAFLEPENFEERYCIKPPGTDRRTKEGKNKYEKWLALQDGKTVVTAPEWSRALGCADALHKHARIINMLKLELETELVAYAEFDNILLRARMDLVSFDKNIIVDLKTTSDASPNGFMKSIHKYGYDFQGAWYADIYKKLTGESPLVVLIAVETKPPHLITLHELSKPWLDKGRKKYLQALRIYQNCEKNKTWPGYDEKFLVSVPAKWMLDEDKNET